MKDLGYTKPLYVLPFDHRNSFVKKMFGVSGKDITDEIREQVRDLKLIVYEGFKKAVPSTVPQAEAAILVDEEYGEKILHDAVDRGFNILLPIEKSGQDEFDFEYGDNFPFHIEEYNPTFVKALVRYNPEDEESSRTGQLEKLKIATDYCHEHGHKFLVEALIPPLAKHIESRDEKSFDIDVRPALVIELVKQFQEAGVEADVWKMEGMEKEEDYEELVKQVQADGRNNVGVVILGRGETKENVDRWIKAGAKVDGVIGFAVGRTVFWDALVAFKEGESSREEAAQRIADNYVYYYNLFNNT